MPSRPAPFAPVASDLVFPFPRNWQAFIFFAVLGFLHLANATYSIASARYESYLSLVFGSFFIAAAVGCRLMVCDLGIMQAERRLRLRTRLGRLASERSIEFAQVHGVRYFSRGSESGNGARVEILCENEDIECPPTAISRQQAMCLAILLNVPLIKVTDGEDVEPDRSVPQAQPN